MGSDAAIPIGMSESGYKSIPFPPARQTVIDSGWLGARRHLSHALIEVDITDLRSWMASQKAGTGQTPSLTGWVVFCLARTIQENPAVQAYRSWRNQLIIFDDADIVTLVEIEKGKVAIPHIIRSANQKSFSQIGEEIQQVKNGTRHSPQENRFSQLSNRAPAFMRQLFWWFLLKNPFWISVTEPRYCGFRSRRFSTARRRSRIPLV